MNVLHRLSAVLWISPLLIGSAALSKEDAPGNKPSADEWQAQMTAATQIQDKGLAAKDQIQQLEQTPKPGTEVEIEMLRAAQKAHFVNAAKEMARLSDLTDDAQLVTMSAMRSGQNFMRAEDYIQAAAMFEKIASMKTVEPDLQAQALYWNALCHERLKNPDEAARIYKAVTKQYPESKWAKFARGRLTDPVFQDTNGS